MLSIHKHCFDSKLGECISHIAQGQRQVTLLGRCYWRRGQTTRGQQGNHDEQQSSCASNNWGA